ncbi:hypothetical protein HanLR1_Chr07g0244371 [Helianthus annuus]|nr:hypothetical protein HanLR1_Chr07g0244371 [Helianthus annuus]
MNFFMFLMFFYLYGVGLRQGCSTPNLVKELLLLFLIVIHIRFYYYC